MKQTMILLAALARTAILGCAAPIPPHSSEAPPEARPAPSANQPSNVETTSAEYDSRSGSTGSSAR
jgi:hypothetical protein